MVNRELLHGKRFVCPDPGCELGQDVRLFAGSSASAAPLCGCLREMKRVYVKPRVRALTGGEVTAELREAKILEGCC